jgi:hypothetical protein
MAVLGGAEPGINDNFFALGGHSLKATQVISRLQQQGRSLTLRDLFNYPTIAELAARLDGQKEETTLTPIPPTPLAADYPASPAQRRLWVLAQMGSAGAYHMADSIRFHGPLEVRALERSLAVLFDRHETLRTAFVEKGDELRQWVAGTVPPALNFTDLSGHSDPLSTARELALEHARAAFDLNRPPLFRVSLLKLGPEDHALLFNMHHIISDGWSLDVLIREFISLYGAAVADQPAPLPPLRIQHRDYVVWQRERLRLLGETQRESWRQQFRDLPPGRDLPPDFARPPFKTCLPPAGAGDGHRRLCASGLSIRPAGTRPQSAARSQPQPLVRCHAGPAKHGQCRPAVAGAADHLVRDRLRRHPVRPALELRGGR